MRILAPAEALRAARALLNLSQRGVAERAGISQKSLSVVENSSYLLADTNLLLVDFYLANNIQFLGEASIGSEITRCGVRWAAPSSQVTGKALEGLHAMDVAVSFKAARAFLGREQTDVAAAAGLTPAAVKGLEAGKTWAESYQTLVRYYKAEGLEFTGWGDPSTGKYYGVGVQWGSDKARS
ncbi:helix-turn-helix domain-containing protein [Rhizobium calliandrae]|uniref:Helix-turn-helix domain-containing protein n=1 Tax=Rhizobium calliandrae TaxID=1312182 RepID=A0ABT7K979_9HYPH|nr:helix-turn-helix domain-containing protein [Rhizobium calliandrae]MDL2405180.1 helix-turn-helix domain-containing protein [Rhizobium calliandrae]